MVRLLSKLVVIFTCGLLLGGAVSWYSIQDNIGFGALRVGAWTAWPLAGDAQADPYTKAKVAADGEVPLGAAEGIAFHARNDDRGDPLQLQCNYRLAGKSPSARVWTLTAHAVEGTALSAGPGRIAQLGSRDIVRQADGSFSIAVGPEAAPGNWLEVTGDGDYQLVFRLYDTAVSGTTGIVDPQMPALEKAGC